MTDRQTVAELASHAYGSLGPHLAGAHAATRTATTSQEQAEAEQFLLVLSRCARQLMPLATVELRVQKRDARTPSDIREMLNGNGEPSMARGPLQAAPPRLTPTTPSPAGAKIDGRTKAGRAAKLAAQTVSDANIWGHGHTEEPQVQKLTAKTPVRRVPTRRSARRA